MPPKSKTAPTAQVEAEAVAPAQSEATAQVEVETVAPVEAEAVVQVEAEAAVDAPAEDQVELAAAEFTHRIAAVVEKGFWRAGHHWPREGVDVNRDNFDEAQWSALEGEPMLTVKPL